MSDDPKSVGDILDRLRDTGQGEDRVTVGDLVEAFGSRGYGPFLLVPALVEESPLGGIPGFSTATAIVIALFAVQMLFGRDHMWLPGFIKRRGFKGDKVVKTTEALRPVARFLDRWFHGRLEVLTRGPAVRVAAAITLLLCLAIPPAELVPWSGTVPMLGIAALGLALLVRDGVLMIVAGLLAVAGVALGIGLLGGR